MDIGAIETLGFFGIVLAFIAYEIIKTRRSLDENRRRAAGLLPPLEVKPKKLWQKVMSPDPRD